MTLAALLQRSREKREAWRYTDLAPLAAQDFVDTQLFGQILHAIARVQRGNPAGAGRVQRPVARRRLSGSSCRSAGPGWLRPVRWSGR